MRYYQEIEIIQQTEINAYHLLTHVVSCIHDRMVVNDTGDIGISFPDYQYNKTSGKGSLGRKIRVFAPTEQKLINLRLRDEMSKISDYIDILDIDDVGDKATSYEVYTRVHTKNIEKEALRLQKHLNAKRSASEQLTYDEVLINCIKWRKETPSHLFVYLKSNSNKHGYQAHIKREVLSKPTNKFYFNTFGLSSSDTEKLSSIPHW